MHTRPDMAPQLSSTLEDTEMENHVRVLAIDHGLAIEYGIADQAWHRAKSHVGGNNLLDQC